MAGRKGQRNFLVFGIALEQAGLGDDWAKARRTRDLSELLPKVQALSDPAYWPEGCKITQLVMLPGDGFCIRSEHPSYGGLWGAIPLRLDWAREPDTAT